MTRPRRPQAKSSRTPARPAPPGVASFGSDRARVRLRGPGGLVACLPQLIGFRPVESVVVVGMVPGRNTAHELGLTLRLDLDDLSAAITDTEAAAAPCHPRSIAAALARNGCTAATLVIVSERCAPPWSELDPDDPGEGARLGLLPALVDAGIEVLDELLVRDGRWWSYQCQQPTCCPLEGTPIAQGDADLLTAELAWAGEPTTVLASRALIEAKVAPVQGLTRDLLAATLAAMPDRPWLASASPEEALTAIAGLIDRFRSAAAERAAEPDVEVDEWARLLLDLTDVRVRDACLAPWKAEVGAAALGLWCAATRLAPPGWVAPPATLAALVAHARGDGALAGESVGRALTDDPSYRLARYAGQALGGGLPPTTVRRMLVESTAVLRAQGWPMLNGSGTVVVPKPRPQAKPTASVRRDELADL